MTNRASGAHRHARGCEDVLRAVYRLGGSTPTFVYGAGIDLDVRLKARIARAHPLATVHDRTFPCTSARSTSGGPRPLGRRPECRSRVRPALPDRYTSHQPRSNDGRGGLPSRLPRSPWQCAVHGRLATSSPASRRRVGRVDQLSPRQLLQTGSGPGSWRALSMGVAIARRMPCGMRLTGPSIAQTGSAVKVSVSV